MSFSRNSATIVFAFLFSSLVALGFVLYTNHAWEDYYITYRASKNLATGHGLVFTPGERVHSFTSPLGVLLPAGASRLTGNRSDLAALWIFRGICIAAFGGAAALLAAALLRLGATRLAAALGVAFIALEAKAVDFTTNGMETGILLFFLAYAFWALCADSKRQWLHLGAAWAGIMWTRPDGFIYIGLLSGGYGLFNFFSSRRQERRSVVTLFVRAGLLCTVLYLPWILWAWGYYGSPVPHTIIAKGSVSPDKNIRGFLATFVLLPVKLWTGQTTVEGTLMPTYYQAITWSPAILYTARVMGAVALCAWFWPRLKPQVRAASLAFHGAHAYLTYFPYFPFPWYFPATGILAAMTWGGVMAHFLADASQVRWWRVVVPAVAGWILLLEIDLTWKAARQMEAKQRLVYTGNLQRIGEWLAQHAAPTDRVFMEPLGYIGYFSQLPTDDFPGLSSPRVVEARKEAKNWSTILMMLDPTWVVLRDSEVNRISQEAPLLLGEVYEPVKVFDVREQVAKAEVADPFMLEFDARFTVYHRRTPQPMSELILNIQHHDGIPARVMFLDSRKVRLVHAPGTMSVRIPAGAQRVEVGYGFVPGAWEREPKTDGASFEVYWADGTRMQKLSSRTLDPVKRPGDRGLQVVTLDLPPAVSDHARLLFHTGTGPTDTKDWTVWADLVFK